MSMRVGPSPMLVFVAVSIFAQSTSWAQTQSIRFAYSVDPSLDSCPDEMWVRQAVSARLGYVPFDEKAARRMEVRIREFAKSLEAVLQVTNADGSSGGKRVMTSATRDCMELVASMEVAIAIAIDPQYASRPAPVAPVAAPPAPTPAPLPATPSSPWGFQMHAGALGSWGLSKELAAGGRFQLAAQKGNGLIGVELRGDLPSAFDVSGGKVSSSLWLVSVSPCYFWGKIGFCGLVSGGSMSVESSVGTKTRVSSPLALAGARVIGSFALSERWFLQPHLEAQAVLTRTTFEAGATQVWQSAPVAASVGVSVGYHFPE